MPPFSARGRALSKNPGDGAAACPPSGLPRRRKRLLLERSAAPVYSLFEDHDATFDAGRLVMFDTIRGWQERRRALREIRIIEKEEAQALHRSDHNPLLQAKMSLNIDDPATALRYWDHAWVRYPNYVKHSADTLDVLLGLKLFDIAEAIMLEGQKRSPHEARYFEGHALVAEHRGDRAVAVARWQQVRKRFPGSWTAHVNAARTLRELGHLDEAEALAKRAVSRFPDIIHGWLEHARIAETAKDWAEAKARWARVSRQFAHVTGALGQARMMVALGGMEEAERFLLEMRLEFEYEADVAIAWARLAEQRGNIELALERWAAVRKRFPQLLLGYQETARLLRALGAAGALEAFLREAAERFPAADWPRADCPALTDQHH